MVGLLAGIGAGKGLAIGSAALRLGHRFLSERDMKKFMEEYERREGVRNVVRALSKGRIDMKPTELGPEPSALTSFVGAAGEGLDVYRNIRSADLDEKMRIQQLEGMERQAERERGAGIALQNEAESRFRRRGPGQLPGTVGQLPENVESPTDYQNQASASRLRAPDDLTGPARVGFMGQALQLDTAARARGFEERRVSVAEEENVIARGRLAAQEENNRLVAKGKADAVSRAAMRERNDFRTDTVNEFKKSPATKRLAEARPNLDALNVILANALGQDKEGYTREELRELEGTIQSMRQITGINMFQRTVDPATVRSEDVALIRVEGQPVMERIKIAWQNIFSGKAQVISRAALEDMQRASALLEQGLEESALSEVNSYFDGMDRAGLEGDLAASLPALRQTVLTAYGLDNLVHEEIPDPVLPIINEEEFQAHETERAERMQRLVQRKAEGAPTAGADSRLRRARLAAERRGSIEQVGESIEGSGHAGPGPNVSDLITSGVRALKPYGRYLRPYQTVGQ